MLEKLFAMGLATSYLVRKKCSKSHLCNLCIVDVWSLAFSPDSRFLATGSHNGRINIFSVEEGKKKSSLDTRGKFILSVAYVSVGGDKCSLSSFSIYFLQPAMLVNFAIYMHNNFDS